MNFYKTISTYYDDIFPLNRAQINFIKESYAEPAKKSLLDIGCGTGHLALELSTIFGQVTGIDLDEAMLHKATQRVPETTTNLKYRHLNMLALDSQFNEASLDGISCFGNTLVHLPDAKTVEIFLHKSYLSLKPSGKLQIQIINYDRIIDQNIDALPTIDNDVITFERDYIYQPSTQSLDFVTTLTIKKTGITIDNKIALYPIRKEELSSLLTKVGFKNIAFFGDFKRGELHTNSIPLIIEAIK